MVSDSGIVSAYSDGFCGKAERIEQGPLYTNIQTVIDGLNVVAGTRQCRKDLASLSKGEADLSDIIKRAVSHGKYHCSEWCLVGSEGKSWAACDSYIFIEKSWIEAAHKEMECEFFIKFFIAKSGALVVTVSYHLSRPRY